jgi:penicillin-insensitive murein endopeptidase
MVEGPRGRVTPDFGPAQLKLVRQAALDERVDRIFVNPVIKRTLCARAAKPEAERAWLRKVRPWWGHDEHMHVRLRCPSGSPECDDQAALPEGDGCDRLGWWFAKRKRQPEPPPKPDPAPEPKPKPARPLPPPECDAVLAAPPQSGP